MVGMRGIPGNERVHIMVGGTRLVCRVLQDRWWFDTEKIEAGEKSKKFFIELKSGKKKSGEASFEGDKALVKEREYVLIYGFQAFVAPEHKKNINLLTDSFYQLRTCDILVAQGDGSEIYSKKTEHHVRKLLKPILVLGGRGVEFELTLPKPVKKSCAFKIKIRLHGLWLFPLKKVGAGGSGVDYRSVHGMTELIGEMKGIKKLIGEFVWLQTRERLAKKKDGLVRKLWFEIRFALIAPVRLLRYLVSCFLCGLSGFKEGWRAPPRKKRGRKRR